MPTWVNVEADSLENFMIEINKRMSWISSRLDSKNVKRLDTNETHVKSANGETEIIGPLLVQKDISGTIRLTQGLNTLTGIFEFGLYNDSGIQNIGLDSNGNAEFAGNIIGGTINIGNGIFTVNESGIVSIHNGTILITRTDNKARVSINSIDGIKLQKGDGTGTVWNDAIYFDIDGNAVIKGIFRSDESPNKRVEIEDNQIRIYNDYNELNGLVTDNSAGQFGDILFYDGSVIGSKLVFSVLNLTNGQGVSLRPENGAELMIGKDGETTRHEGDHIFIGNVAYPIWQGTQAEASAKTDWINGQYAEITDLTLPTLNVDLSTTLASTDVDTATKIATQLNATNTLVNQIKSVFVDFLGYANSL